MRYVEKYGTDGQATDGDITWRMRTACWIPEATNTLTEYVILIAFPMQKLLEERAYVHCLSCFCPV
jgi:hypothetical protein